MNTSANKTVTQKLREAIAPQKVVDRVRTAMIGTTTFVESCMLSCLNAYATPSSTDPKEVVVSIMDTLVDLFPAIGIVIAAIGAFKLFMAFRNDQPDAYSGAAKDIVVGVVLVIFKTFVWNALKTALK